MKASPRRCVSLQRRCGLLYTHVKCKVDSVHKGSLSVLHSVLIKFSHLSVLEIEKKCLHNPNEFRRFLLHVPRSALRLPFSVPKLTGTFKGASQASGR